MGMSSEASAGFHGFCHGATPFSSMLMMPSVTSCRKSRLAGSGDSATGIGFGFADVAIGSALLSVGGKLKFGFFVFEPGSCQRLSADGVQRLLARSIERNHLSVRSRIGHRTDIWSTRQIVKFPHAPPSDGPSASNLSTNVTTDVETSSIQLNEPSGAV